MTHASDVYRWADQLDDLCTRIAPRFSRIEPRRRARAYLQGLLAPLKRKNGWHLAEAAGDASPDGVQDFLARMHWDADAVRDDLRAYVVEHLGDCLDARPPWRQRRPGGLAATRLNRAACSAGWPASARRPGGCAQPHPGIAPSARAGVSCCRPG